MVELFHKNNERLLAANFFSQKSLTTNVRLCPKNASVACKEKNKLTYIILHNFNII